MMGVGCARRLLVLPLLLIPPLMSFLHCSVLPEMLFASGSWPIDDGYNRSNQDGKAALLLDVRLSIPIVRLRLDENRLRGRF
jgi:hypothetical protein